MRMNTTPWPNWGDAMYLSRFQLDMRKRETMIALVNRARFHGAVESAFEGARERRLWRLDTLQGRNYLMILSAEKPFLDNAVGQFGVPGTAETRCCDGLMERIAEGGLWHFRLTANPVKCAPRKGKLMAHITPQYQKEWLMARAQRHGFELEYERFAVVQSEWVNFSKNTSGDHVTLLGVTYEGILRVTDAALLRETLKNGMGHGKAYGMGLMTLVSAEHIV